METVAPLAGTISAYGLYAIVAFLVVAVVYLYKQQGSLQKDVRTLLETTLNETKIALNENSRVICEASKVIEAQGEMLKDRRK